MAPCVMRAVCRASHLGIACDDNREDGEYQTDESRYSYACQRSQDTQQRPTHHKPSNEPPEDCGQEPSPPPLIQHRQRIPQTPPPLPRFALHPVHTPHRLCKQRSCTPGVRASHATSASTHGRCTARTVTAKSSTWCRIM